MLEERCRARSCSPTEPQTSPAARRASQPAFHRRQAQARGSELQGETYYIARHLSSQLSFVGAGGVIRDRTSRRVFSVEAAVSSRCNYHLSSGHRTESNFYLREVGIRRCPSRRRNSGLDEALNSILRVSPLISPEFGAKIARRLAQELRFAGFGFPGAHSLSGVPNTPFPYGTPPPAPRFASGFRPCSPRNANASRICAPKVLAIFRGYYHQSNSSPRWISTARRK